MLKEVSKESLKPVFLPHFFINVRIQIALNYSFTTIYDKVMLCKDELDYKHNCKWFNNCPRGQTAADGHMCQSRLNVSHKLTQNQDSTGTCGELIML